MESSGAPLSVLIIADDPQLALKLENRLSAVEGWSAETIVSRAGEALWKTLTAAPRDLVFLPETTSSPWPR